MKKLLLSLFAFCILNSAFASDRITALVTVTNATVNGMTFTVNGNIRAFTNNVVTSSSQVLTNSDTTGCGSKTNLFAQIALNPFSQVTPVNTGSNTFQLSAPCGAALVVSASAGYASVSYSTQTCATATPVGVSFTSYYPSPTKRVIVASQLIEDLNTYADQPFSQVSTLALELLGTTNTQTITGAKTFTAAFLSDGCTTSDLTNNGTTKFDQMELVFPGGGADQSYFFTNSNGTLMITNQGDRGRMTLSSDGNLTVSGQILSLSQIVGPFLGDGGSLTNLNAAKLTNSIPPAPLSGATITNLSHAGFESYPANSDIAFTRFPIASLTIGNNAAVPVGTNVFVEVSGPGGAFTINGIANGRDGKMIVIVNQTGFDMTVAHQSGTDPTAANRIISMTGADRATTGNGSATLIYSGAASRWLLISFDP